MVPPEKRTAVPISPASSPRARASPASVRASSSSRHMTFGLPCIVGMGNLPPRVSDTLRQDRFDNDPGKGRVCLAVKDQFFDFHPVDHAEPVAGSRDILPLLVGNGKVVVDVVEDIVVLDGHPASLVKEYPLLVGGDFVAADLPLALPLDPDA